MEDRYGSSLSFPTVAVGGPNCDTYHLGDGCLLHAHRSGLLTVSVVRDKNSDDTREQELFVHRDPDGSAVLACLKLADQDSSASWFLLVDQSGNFKLLRYDRKALQDSKLFTFSISVSLTSKINKLVATSEVRDAESSIPAVFHLLAATETGLYSTHIFVGEVNISESVERDVLLQQFKRVDWVRRGEVCYKIGGILPVTATRFWVFGKDFERLLSVEVEVVEVRGQGCDGGGGRAIEVKVKSDLAIEASTILLLGTDSKIELTSTEDKHEFMLLPRNRHMEGFQELPLDSHFILAQLLTASEFRFVLHRGSFMLLSVLPKSGVTLDRLVLDHVSGKFTISGPNYSGRQSEEQVQVGIITLHPQLPPQTGLTNSWILRASSLPLSIHLQTNIPEITHVTSPSQFGQVSDIGPSLLPLLKPVLAASDNARSCLCGTQSKDLLKTKNRVLFDSLYPSLDADLVASSANQLADLILPLLQVDEGNDHSN